MKYILIIDKRFVEEVIECKDEEEVIKNIIKFEIRNNNLDQDQYSYSFYVVKGELIIDDDCPMNNIGERIMNKVNSSMKDIIDKEKEENIRQENIMIKNKHLREENDERKEYERLKKKYE